METERVSTLEVSSHERQWTNNLALDTQHVKVYDCCQTLCAGSVLLEDLPDRGSDRMFFRCVLGVRSLHHPEVHGLSLRPSRRYWRTTSSR